MPPVLSIANLGKTYGKGAPALQGINLDIDRGEIFALLGPNGAGKTTLISIVCGIVSPSEGTVTIDGADILRDYRSARFKVGLVPQELTTDAFESVWSTVSFSRGLFGRPPDPPRIEQLLRDLSLWEKRDAKIMTLSGGMKRRVLIAKALSHDPEILFLDEPTAGVDVELRRDMWALVRRLRASGVTVILTTHYIDEAEEMADRIGVINKGKLILAEEKTKLMQTLGKRTLTLQLQQPLPSVPAALGDWGLSLNAAGTELQYTFDAHPGGGGAHVESGDAPAGGVPALLRRLDQLGIAFRDLNTRQSSLEEIFVNLIHAPNAASPGAQKPAQKEARP